LHGGCDALRIVLHSLKAKIHSEVPTTRFTVENLNIAILVTSQAIFRYFSGLAVQAGIDRNWLNYYVFTYFVSQFETELTSPNVLAFHFSVDMVRA
jgi:hypothetical protein